MIKGKAPSAERVAYAMVRTHLEAAVSRANPSQRARLAEVAAHVTQLGLDRDIDDADLVTLLAQHAVTRPAALAILPSLEQSPRWQALDNCLRSLLDGPIDARAAIEHAKNKRGEAPAG